MFHFCFYYLAIEDIIPATALAMPTSPYITTIDIIYHISFSLRLAFSLAPAIIYLTPNIRPTTINTAVAIITRIFPIGKSLETASEVVIAGVAFTKDCPCEIIVSGSNVALLVLVPLVVVLVAAFE